MSTSRGSGAGNGGVAQPVPAGSRKVVQSLKEIVNCPEAEIYATLKECNMDPNEAVNRLLSQDPFHEVKSKREKKKEGKDQPESRSRGANSNSNRGNKIGADRQYARSPSAQYYTSDSSLHGKVAYTKENGSDHYSSLLSSGRGGSNNRSRGPSGPSDDASAESKGPLLGTADGLPAVSLPASGYQMPARVGTPSQVSMADIVRMGWPNKKGSSAPHHKIHDPFVNESLHTDCVPKGNQSGFLSVQLVPTGDEWPSIEKPAALSVIPVQDHPDDPELHPEASGVSYDGINHAYEAEEVQDGEDDNFESSGESDAGSVCISSRMIPEDVSRVASQFENELYKNMGTYESEVHDIERHEVDEVGASVTSATRNLQQLSINEDDEGFPSEAIAPSVVIPEHLQVQTADCSHLSFGSFGSALGAPYPSGTKTSLPEKSYLEEAQNKAEESTGGQPKTRNSATVESYGASSAPQLEEFRPESAAMAHGNQFPSSSSGYTFDDVQLLNAAFHQTSSQMQSLAPFSNIMHAYANSLPSALLAANDHPTRESDLQFSPFSLTQSLTSNYGDSVSSIGASAISISEALKTPGLQSSQPVPSILSENMANATPLPQPPAAVYSHPTVALGPFSNMYPFLPQSYTYMPSAFQQSFAGSSNYHQSLAGILPQYKSSVSVSSLPPQSAVITTGYSGFGNSSTIPGNYSMNSAAGAPTGTSLSYDDLLSSQYKDISHLLSLQQIQNENSAMWLHGNSRMMPAVPANTYYNYQTQNQQPGGLSQVQQQQQQQQSQNYGSAGYPNFYHSQAGISLDQQHQNRRDGLVAGSQGQPKQTQIWPNNY